MLFSEYAFHDNPQTRSVSRSICKSEMLSEMARHACDYQDFRRAIRAIGIVETAEQVAYNDSALDIAELDKLIAQMKV